LIGKGRQKGDVLLLERSHLRPENDDCAKRPALPYQRHGKSGPVPMLNRKFSAAREVVTSILQVDDVDTSEALAYIEREYKDVKGRVELQRRVVEQLHMVEADVGEAEASLNALLEDEASKLRILEWTA
jgi:hypothetical protein